MLSFSSVPVGKVSSHRGGAFRAEAGDLIISYLQKIGVEYVFGVPGGAIEPLYNALARSARRGGPRAVVARRAVMTERFDVSRLGNLHASQFSERFRATVHI